MTFHEKFAGAESVYAFLGGFPRIRSSAEFAAGFRVQAEQEIERLIALLDVLDGDADLEPAFGYIPPGYHDEQETDADTDEGDEDADDEPSLGRHEFSGAWEPSNLHLYGETVWRGFHGDDREHDVGDMAEHDLDKNEGEDSEDREPDIDSEPSLGWRCGPEINQARHDICNGVTDGEVDAGEEMERCDHETGFSGPLTEIERAAVAMIRRKANMIGRRPLHDPELCTIRTAGVDRMGACL